MRVSDDWSLTSMKYCERTRNKFAAVTCAGIYIYIYLSRSHVSSKFNYSNETTILISHFSQQQLQNDEIIPNEMNIPSRLNLRRIWQAEAASWIENIPFY